MILGRRETPRAPHLQFSAWGHQQNDKEVESNACSAEQKGYRPSLEYTWSLEFVRQDIKKEEAAQRRVTKKTS